MPEITIETQSELSGFKLFFEHARNGFRGLDEFDNSNKSNNFRNAIGSDIIIF